MKPGPRFRIELAQDVPLVIVGDAVGVDPYGHREVSFSQLQNIGSRNRDVAAEPVERGLFCGQLDPMIHTVGTRRHRVLRVAHQFPACHRTFGGESLKLQEDEKRTSNGNLIYLYGVSHW